MPITNTNFSVFLYEFGDDESSIEEMEIWRIYDVLNECIRLLKQTIHRRTMIDTPLVEEAHLINSAIENSDMPSIKHQIVLETTTGMKMIIYQQHHILNLVDWVSRAGFHFIDSACSLSPRKMLKLVTQRLIVFLY